MASQVKSETWLELVEKNTDYEIVKKILFDADGDLHIIDVTNRESIVLHATDVPAVRDWLTRNLERGA